MANEYSSVESDAYISRMKIARKGAAVLKSRLVSLRSSLPSVLIFAFEGGDDKIVYYHWITRVRPNIQYEPFPCDGKKHVLQLKEVVDRDLSGIGDGLYFFIDRDFDDLRGHAPAPSIFMTDAYSVENYLVSERVLEEILKNEFHCHAIPEHRKAVLSLFTNAYTEFLDITREANYRLYLARRLNIELTAHLPDKISQLANISIENVVAGTRTVENQVRVQREPTQAELDNNVKAFSDLDPRKRYRGKFSLLFFCKWLEHLANDRNQTNPKYFPPIENGTKANPHTLTLSSFASKSELPVGLFDFLAQLTAPKQA